MTWFLKLDIQGTYVMTDSFFSTFIYVLVLICPSTYSFMCNFIALIMIPGRLRFQ